MRILGIDPGSSVTGFGVVERVGSRVKHVAHGTWRAPRGTPLAARLAALHRALCDVIAAHRPELAVVERVFVAASPRAALVLGHARGVALAAASAAGLIVHELSPSEIKQSVAGSGLAEKQQVQAMVQRLLGLPAPPPRDASDALAAAICQGHAGPLAGLLRRARPARRRSAAPAGARFVVRRLR